MRNTKKAISILLTLLMVVGMMSTFAFADDPISGVKITDGTEDVTSQYEAYQILKGTLDTERTESENASVKNLTWGSAITSAITVNGNTYPHTVKGAVDFANSLKGTGYEYDGSKSVALATALEKICREASATTVTLSETGMEPGYYLIKQKTSNNTKADTRFMLSVVGKKTVDIESKKTTAPDPDKKVLVNNKPASESTAYVGMQSTFEISAKLPESATYDAYTAYELLFKDTLPDGLTYDKSQSIKVYYYITDKEDTTPITNYEKSEPTIAEGKLGGGIFTVKMNAKALSIPAEATIVVKYTATLNKDAKSGNDGNTNGFEVVYPQSPKGGVVTTPKKEVKVYSGKIIIDKFDGNDTSTKLAGAKFVVKNKEGLFLAKNDKEEVSWVSVSRWDKEKAYITIDGEEQELTNVVVVTTDSNGTATIEGLKAGKYYLKEVVAPTNYNLLDDEDGFEIELSLTKGEDGKVVSMQKTASIANNSGSTLPETGGIGTTIFYLIGAILVIGAGVVFVTRRRMHSDK